MSGRSPTTGAPGTIIALYTDGLVETRTRSRPGHYRPPRHPGHHRRGPDDEIARLSTEYPTGIPDPSGERLWLSRLPREDPRIGSEYETEYARWIPGDPFEALLGVFIVVPEGNPGEDGLPAIPRGIPKPP